MKKNDDDIETIMKNLKTETVSEEFQEIKRTDSWTMIGEKILAASRTELYMSMRYMYLALNSLGFVRNQKTFYVGCDGLNIYYNPMKLSQRYKYNPTLVNRAYIHMVIHCIFRHLYMTERYMDEERWNIACDVATEYLIDGMDHASVRQMIPDVRESVYRILEEKYPVISAENVYGYLEDIEDSQIIRLSAAFLVDDHSFWYEKKKQSGRSDDGDNENKDNDKDNNDKDNNDKDDNDKENNNDNGDGKNGKDNQDRQNEQDKKDNSNGGKNRNLNNSEKWKEISENMQTAISAFQGGAGNEKNRLSKHLAARNSDRMSYGDFLKKFAVARETMQVDMDSFDYGFYNYGMEMYGNMPLIEELEYKEEMRIEDFVIVLDTSGSCSGTLIRNFLEETYSILSERESFFNKINLHIIQCDNEVQSDICIHSREELEEYRNNFIVKGFGGTDFRPAFEYVNTLIDQKQFNRLNGLLYFTDGNGIYPKRKPKYQTAFVFVETKGEVKKVPPWAIKLEIN